jgi:hypothetical protein
LALKQLYPKSSSMEVSFSCKIHTSIQCHPLPVEVRNIQEEALWQIHSGCYRKLYSAHNLTFCSLCAMNERGIRSKLRLSSFTGDLSCDSCPKGSVVKVNMLGVILNICNTSYYMCPCCTKVQVWRGDGMDLCNYLQSIDDYSERMRLRIDMYRSEGPCNCYHFLGKDNNNCPVDQSFLGTKTLIQTKPPSDDSDLPRCMVCDAKNTKKPFMVLPDVHRKILVRYEPFISIVYFYLC